MKKLPGKNEMSATPDFKKASSEKAARQDLSKPKELAKVDHAPAGSLAPQPKGMGENSVNRQVHAARQSRLVGATKETKNQNQNNQVEANRARRAFDMARSKNGAGKDNPRER